MVFKNPLDNFTKILSALVFLIPLGIFFFVNISEGFELTSLIVFIIILPIFAITWALHPQDYTVNEQGISIKRPYKSILIAANDIKSIEALTPADLKYSMRLFGSGGFFGYFGLFANQKLGRYHIYAGNRVNPVLILTEKKKYVLTPTDPEGFIAAVKGLNQT
jgi:hypothetical protein